MNVTWTPVFFTYQPIHFNLIVYSPHIFQILWATLIGTVIIPALVHARPRDRREIVSGLQKLHELCPSWQPAGNHSACVEAKFDCYNYMETVCKVAEFACLSAIPNHGYPKCEPDKQKIISITVKGVQTRVVQTLSCSCAN